jgi:uncharacterized membrane protein
MMSSLLTDLLLRTAVMSTMLAGGVYFAFSSFAMRALGQSGASGAEVMRMINRVILRSAFMPLFFGSTVLAAAAALLGLSRLPDLSGWLMLSGGAVYVLGMFGVTAACNAPLNNRLDEAPEAVWPEYLESWTRWNHVRTAACLIAGALLLLAMRT